MRSSGSSDATPTWRSSRACPSWSTSGPAASIATLDIASTPPATGWWTSTGSRARSAARRASRSSASTGSARPACGSTRACARTSRTGTSPCATSWSWRAADRGRASARYLYRRRADGTSSVQRSHGDPDRYTAVFEHGYLDVIARAKAHHGAAARMAPAGARLRADLVPDGGRAPTAAATRRRPRPGVPPAPRRRPAGAGPGRRRRPPGPAPQAELARHLRPCRPTGAVAVADGRRDPRRRGDAPRAGRRTGSRARRRPRP